MKNGEHAKLMAVLSGGKEAMGPQVRALYNQLMVKPDEECIQAESQVVYAFLHALKQDHDTEDDN